MYCYLENCDNDKVEDCLMQHARNLEASLSLIIAHYQAMKKVTDETKNSKIKLERKYEKLKEKKQKLEKSLQKNDPRKSSISDDAPCPQIQLNVPLRNILDSESPDKMFKPSSKKVRGKENSPKKHINKPSFTRIGEQFKHKLPATSSPKPLKQQKLSFSRLEPSEPIKLSTEETDDDKTFCEPLERIKTTSYEKAKEVNKNRRSDERKTSKSPSKELFAFQQPKVESLKALTPSYDDQPKVDEHKDVHVKRERLISESNSIRSDIDIFQSDNSDAELSCGSSVIIMEDEPQVITIPDNTIFSDDSLLKSLEKGFINQSEYCNPVERFEKKAVKFPKKRTKIYKECNECVEFYDAYEAEHGATEADLYVRDCPKRCKGNSIRRKKAEPPPLLTHGPPRNTISTPEGFWDIPYTPEPVDDDPDRTQDGL